MTPDSRRPRPERERAYAQWSALHGGIDPASSVWIRGWVTLSHACARPLARRGVAPGTVTGAGLLVSACVPVLAALGAGWPLLAGAVVVLGAVLDGVDGAVAAQTGTASRWGSVLDSLVDRCSDLLLVLALVLLGAPVLLGVLVGALTLLLEYARALAHGQGMIGPGVLSLWERPSRVILGTLATVCCGAAWAAGRGGVELPGLPDDPVAAAAAVATGAVWIGLVLGVVGLLQVVRSVRRALG